MRSTLKLIDDTVVNPKASRLDPKVHDPVVFCPVGVLTVLAARLFKAGKKFIPFEPARAYDVKSHGRRASLVGPAMGAPAAAYVLERLVANQVRHVIMLGLCGSIHPDVRIGDLVVPIGARIEEGTSPHYVSDTRKAYPSDEALTAVKESMHGYRKSHHLGPVWTTDAVFRETRKKVREYGSKGLLAVEMEASALFTVAAYRGIDLASVLVVSDELFNLRWRMGFTHPRFLLACRHACHIALDAAFRLAGVPAPELEDGEGLEDDPDAGPDEEEDSSSPDDAEQGGGD